MFVGAKIEGTLLEALVKRQEATSMSKAGIIKQALFEFFEVDGWKQAKPRNPTCG